METQHEDFRTKLERKKKSDHPFRSKLLHNVPIGLKYLSLFLISVVLFLGATMIVYLQLSSVKKDVLTIIDNSEMTNSLTELSMLIEKRQSTITSYAVSKNEQHIAEFEKTNEQIDEMFQQLDSVFIGTENEADYVSIKENAASVSNILHHSLIPKVENGENVTSTLLEIDA
ncbi:MAG: hypothetical protein GX374_09775 [Bacilli bacterium]|nr:hypothetical protein [Bacilli bacterium]